MSIKTAANEEWQEEGGILEIPDGWFVSGANFDASEPYIEISAPEGTPDRKKLPCPKSLAYYLSMHSCGSQHLRDTIVRNARIAIQNQIKGALGL